MTRSQNAWVWRIGVAAVVVGGCVAAGLATGVPRVLGKTSHTDEKGQTLGFVVYDWTTAIRQTRFMDECPQGLNPGNDEYWWRSISKADRSRFTDNGRITQIMRQVHANHRGPHGEDVCEQPELINDPPLYTAEGKYSYGANLDGTSDGHETASTCTHEKFTGVDGTPAVDNQLYRLMGCIYGWRSEGNLDIYANGHRVTNGLGMILIEVTGVDDPRNDDDVRVAFYRSVDQFTLDVAGNPLPFSTYRVDQQDGKERYGDIVKGKIVDGILTTEPSDVRLPYYVNYEYHILHLEKMSIQLKIANDGATADGLLTAYYPTDQWWRYVREIGLQPPSSYNCPAIWAGLNKLADGDRDPNTGACRSISSAFKIKSVAAFIRHPGEGGNVAGATDRQPRLVAR
jgi:hypothetical protein